MGFFDFLKKKKADTVEDTVQNVEEEVEVDEEPSVRVYKYNERYEIPFPVTTLDLSEYKHESDENSIRFDIVDSLLYVRSDLPLRHSEVIIRHNYLVDEDHNVLETYTLNKTFKVTNLNFDVEIIMSKDGYIKIIG